MDSEKDHNFLLQWALVDCLVAERADSLLESPGIPIFKTQNSPPPRQKKFSCSQNATTEPTSVMQDSTDTMEHKASR